MFDNNRGSTHRIYCKRCFGHSVTQQALNNHQRYCTHPEVCNQVIILPSPGTIDHFHNIQNKFTCPIVVYADCEAITKPVTEGQAKGGRYQQHIPCSVAYKVISSVKGYPDKPLRLYTEEDCVERFLRDMLELEEKSLHCYLWIIILISIEYRRMMIRLGVILTGLLSVLFVVNHSLMKDLDEKRFNIWTMRLAIISA